MTYAADSQALQLQNAAYQAACEEQVAMSQWMDGVITESDYCAAMEAVEMACQRAIAAGVSRRDLPAH